MQYRITLLSLLSICFTPLFGQLYDEVSVGKNYALQTYYNIEKGTSISIANDAWDIAFTNIGQQDAGVLYNESSDLNAAPLKVFLSNAKSWEEVTTDTTIYADSLSLLNPKKNWSEGAFNTVKSSPSPFDYGWGVYNTTTKVVEGSKIFIIKKRDNTFIKFQIIKLLINDYIFKYANLDGSNEVTATVSKDKTSPSKLIHFSFKTGQKVEIPTDYDLIFQRYIDAVPVGDGTFLKYNVLGVLLANGIEAVKVDSIDPTSIEEKNYASKYSKLPTVIGYDWKAFDFASGWSVDEDRTHFVKMRNGDKYQISFVDFQGSLSGITTVEKIKVFTNDVNNVIYNISGLTIGPNPCSNILNIHGLAKNADVVIMDASGRIVKKVNTTSTVDVSTLNTGIYLMQVNTAEGQSRLSFIKQ